MLTDEQHMCPPRMRSNAVGGGDCTLSLAWDGAVMMPLQYTVTTGHCKAKLKIFNQLYLTETYARAGGKICMYN